MNLFIKLNLGLVDSDVSGVTLLRILNLRLEDSDTSEDSVVNLLRILNLDLVDCVD